MRAAPSRKSSRAAPARKTARATRKKLASPRRGAVKKGPALRAHVEEVIRRLKRQHPDAHCELDHSNPYQLLVATILSAQCTDKRVNMVTPALFKEYPDATSLAAADPGRMQDMIRSTGFFRSKTKSLLGMANGVVERHGGEIPATMDELTTLPGVGRKTANVVLGNAFDRQEGIVVDTHVQRLVVRLGITNETDPVKIERLLVTLVDRADWTIFSHLLIFHGRRVCIARLPLCEACVLNDICPSSHVKPARPRT